MNDTPGASISLLIKQNLGHGFPSSAPTSTVRSPQVWQGQGGGRRWDADLSVHRVGGAPPRLLQGWVQGGGGGPGGTVRPGAWAARCTAAYRALLLSDSEQLINHFNLSLDWKSCPQGTALFVGEQTRT